MKRAPLAALSLALIQAAPPPATPEALSRLVAGWPEIPRLEAGRLAAKYGMPDEVHAARLVWRERGDWSDISLHREEDFSRRSGVLEQSVRFEVPVARWRDLSALGVGVSFAPEDGTLTASAESEEGNCLALNVAVEVIRGRRTVDEARAFYRRSLDLAVSGKSTRYTSGLLFAPGRRKPMRRPAWLQPMMP